MSITTNDPLLEEMSPPFQDNFDCYICHKIFKTKFLLKRHIKIHVENPVNCKICNIKLKHIMSLKRHMNLVHQISDHGGLFLYLFAPEFLLFFIYSFKDSKVNSVEKEFVEAEIEIIPKDEKLSEDEFEVFEVIDTDDEEIVDNGEDLFNDLDDDYMLPVNPEIIKCAFCDDRFTDAQTLQDHLQTHITNAPKIYRCAICQMDFTCKISVGIHMQEHIKTKNERKPNKCKRCLERFENVSQLQIHNNKVHKKIYVCPICDKIFDAREQIIPHIKTHVDSNIFTCPLASCKLVLNNNDELRDHIAAHNSKLNKQTGTNSIFYLFFFLFL